MSKQEDIAERVANQACKDSNTDGAEDAAIQAKLKVAATKFNGKNPNPIVTKSGNATGFGPGNQVNIKGRPKGSVSGRTKTLRLIDAILEQPEIQAALAAALAETILSGNKQALDTLRTIVMPLTPKEVLIKGDGDKPQATKLGVKIVVAQQATGTSEAIATVVSETGGQQQ